MMKGLVYKEFRQNWWLMLLMIVFGFMPAIFLHMAEGIVSDPEYNGFRTGGMAAGLIAALLMQTNVMKGDDRRSWGYFITSTPAGFKGFMLVKYLVTAFMTVVFFASNILCDSLLCMKLEAGGITGLSDISRLRIMLLFAGILSTAFDLPFTVRFGDKKGNTIKLILCILSVIIVSAMILENTFNINVHLYNLGSSLLGADKNTVTAVTYTSVILLFIFSWFVSCRLYLKGVERFDK